MINNIVQWAAENRMAVVLMAIAADVIANVVILKIIREPLRFAVPGLIFVKLVNFAKYTFLLTGVSYVFLAIALFGFAKGENNIIGGSLELAGLAILLKILIAGGLKKTEAENAEKNKAGHS